MCPTGNALLIGNGDVPHRKCTPHREWGCDSPGMHILTGNGDVPHREWGCDSLGMHILTGSAHSLYKVCFYIVVGIFANQHTKSSEKHKRFTVTAP